MVVKRAEVAELFFVTLVVGGIGYTAWFLLTAGYLPRPFFYGSQSFFTDWTAPVYYSVNPGAYTQFYSVYPPLSFDFLRIFSINRCYRYDDIFASRECDWLSTVTLLSAYLITIPIIFYFYKIADKRTAVMRTIAICMGLPIVYALERGNLIGPCFVFFVLGQGRLLKSARWKWLALATSINFKPYLILALAGPFLRRRWRFLEGCAVAGLAVYLVTYALEGAGDPLTVLTNIGLFATSDPRGIFERSTYASSFIPLIDLLKSAFPVMYFVGSHPMELLDWLLPLLINIGRLGVIASFLCAMVRPGIITTHRLSALGIAYVITTQDPGGYAVIFLLFLVFLERWRGFFPIMALVCAYLLSITADYIVVKFSHEIINSYLTNRVVGYDLGATVGMFARPTLILFLEYALVGACLVDFYKSLRKEPFVLARSNRTGTAISAS